MIETLTPLAALVASPLNVRRPARPGRVRSSSPIADGKRLARPARRLSIAMSGVPHSPQNFWVAAFIAPQEGQGASGVRARCGWARVPSTSAIAAARASLMASASR